MRYLTFNEVLEIYLRMIEKSGGLKGIRDIGALKSAIAQPQMSFGGQDLYKDIIEKTAVLGFTIIMNHPFVDGNKRVGHAAIETMLYLNGYEIEAGVDEQEETILKVAAGKIKLDEFKKWLREHVIKIK